MGRAARWLPLSLALAVLADPRRLLAQAATALQPGSRVERKLTPGSVHRYEVALLPGQFFHLHLEQNHLDLMIRILSPTGAVLAEADNGADREDPFELSLVTANGGIHRIDIRMRRGKSASGRYRLLTAPPRIATSEDEKRIVAERLLSEADRLMARQQADSLKEALTRYERVLAAWREMGDRREEAATLGRMSDALGELGDLREALDRANEAVALWRLEGDRRGEAAALSRAGLAYSEVGDQRRALELLEQALALRRADGNLYGQAETLNFIAVARGALGEKPEAVARYTEALEFARATGDLPQQGMILKNRALDLLDLGEIDRALTDLKAALRRFREIGIRYLEGVTEYSLGNVFLDRNELPEALRRYDRALTILREAGDKRFEAFTLDGRGLLHLAERKPKLALADFERARELLHESNDPRGEAMTMANIGRAWLEMGDAAARDRLSEALPYVQASGDRVHEAIALVHLARAERALGNLDASRSRLEEALRLTESLRGSIPGVGERASYMARTRDRYDLLIEILMDLHKKEPGRGWDAEALLASERAKARSLVELLAEARIHLREGIDENLLAQERSLESQIETRRREEQRVLAGIATGPRRPDADARSLDALLVEYEDVEARIRAASPRFAALARPRPLGLKEIREEVLDADTVLVEYALGETRSFVWVAAPDHQLVTRELPSRAVIEEAARRLYRAWSAGNSVEEAEVGRRARALSRLLLGPVADQIAHDRKRLAIVAEGALQYIPFAALPLPGRSNSAPVVSRHEVVMLPSATTLAVLRQETSGHRSPERRVAVLADPVFDRSDSRLSLGKPRGAHAEPTSAVNDALTRSMHESGLHRLERLNGTRREAEEIAALAGRRSILEALDFQASRSTALGPEVAGARIVHFATHSLLNARHPELSGIVLSLLDEHGHALDGFLQTRDVYKMHLSADLVVLSACQTALGKDVRGEGLLGLSRGFMYAGAPRIVASLWRVPDRATAELMKHFYRGILTEGLRPAAALRAAQNAIRREKLWSSPYSWAAFTLQGDWN